MKAIVVGAGPVGCMAALRCRERGWDVAVFEAASDLRGKTRTGRRSINLTLSRRGIRTLPRPVCDTLYAHGVPCSERIVHQLDGTTRTQPYGLTPEEHLLSISRELLNRLLLDLVGAAGIDVAFGHECMRVLPQEAGATFRHRGGEAQVEADILLGCDGSNSVVRQEMSRRGARLDLMQRYIAHSYVELIIPSPGGGRYCWSDSDANAARPMALHVWPRGNLMLLALPNGDGTYTASLFAPTHTADAAEPSFERLTRPSDFVDLFEKYYPDALPHIPNLATDLAAAQPAALRTIKCAPYHHGRTVLLGDAAHTMAPFFGQGVNSGFEDVHHLFALLDRDLPGRDLPADVCRRLAEFSTSRVSQGHAITDLSLGNFQELVDHSGTRAFQARHRIERELHLRSPDTFRPLLNMVSFSDLQYDEVASVHRHQAAALDELCRTYDSITQGDRIVEAYLAMQQGRGIPDLTAALLPTLSAMGRIETDRHS